MSGEEKAIQLIAREIQRFLRQDLCVLETHGQDGPRLLFIITLGEFGAYDGLQLSAGLFCQTGALPF